MTLTAKDVAEIIKLLEQSRFDSLSLEMDGMKLNLQRSCTVPVSQTHNNAAAQTATGVPPHFDGARAIYQQNAVAMSTQKEPRCLQSGQRLRLCPRAAARSRSV